MELLNIYLIGHKGVMANHFKTTTPTIQIKTVKLSITHYVTEKRDCLNLGSKSNHIQ